MDRTKVIASVVEELHSTERAIDTAITRATTLVQAMIGARSVLDLSLVAAAGSQSKATETIAALGVARDAVVACHAELQKDHRRFGWGVYALGPMNKPDDWDRPIEPTWREQAA